MLVLILLKFVIYLAITWWFLVRILVDQGVS